MSNLWFIQATWLIMQICKLKKLLKVAKVANKLNFLFYPSRSWINQKTLYLWTFPGLVHNIWDRLLDYYLPYHHVTPTPHHITSHRISSHHIALTITSHRILSYHITSHRIASHRIASHHITQRQITSDERRTTSTTYTSQLELCHCISLALFHPHLT